MSERPSPEGSRADAAEEALSELEALRDAGDVDGLLRLARAHRTGDGATKDLRACLAAYEAAASLGDAEAHNAVALFYLAGGVVPQDLKRGASHLRTAADAGHAAARVYLANMYELGVHYGKDAQKADVWYRSAARGANITAAADSPEHDRAMAELGSVRHLFRLRATGLADADDQALTRKAMQLGLRLASRQGSDPGERASGIADARTSAANAASTPSAATKRESATATGAVGEAAGTGTKADATGSAKTARDALAREKLATLDKQVKVKKKGKLTVKDGALGFGYTLMFFAVAAGAGHALTQGAHVLLETRAALPVLGTRTHLVLPIALAVLGALPTLLVYRASTVLRALVASAVAFGVGWAVWGTGSGAFLHERMEQSGAAAVAGFLAALFVFGILGGTKKTDPHAKL